MGNGRQVRWQSSGSGGTTSPLTTKGDLWGFSTVNARLPVGADGTFPVANSGAALGIGWRALADGDIPASLSGKTLVTPIIASLVNATHNHQNAAGGGTLDASAIATGQLALARGGTNADLSATGAANSFLKQSSVGAAISVGTIASADINTALTTPGPIGGSTANTGAFTTLSGLVTDAATATVTDIFTLEHDSSGVPAANFGTGILFKGHSSTNTSRQMAEITATWSGATDASRVAKLTFAASDSAASKVLLELSQSASINTIANFPLGTIFIRNAGNSVVNLTSTVALWADALNFQLGTTTGTKFGTATNQKLSLWNATPVIQQTTGSAAATFVANTSGIANDTATFDGYTIGQIVKILRTIGAAA